MEELPKWKTLSSKYIVNDRWLKLRADSCLTPDGHTLDPWYVLEYSDWVNCMTIDKDNNVILLRHYRHGIDDFVPEMVGGNIDPNDSPLATIKREIHEETGYTGGTVYPTGITYANPSSQNNKLHTFLAVGGSCSDDQQKEIGADFLIEKVPFKDFVRTVSEPNSPITYQSLHLAGIFFALNFIRQSSDKKLRQLREQLEFLERGKGDI